MHSHLYDYTSCHEICINHFLLNFFFHFVSLLVPQHTNTGHQYLPKTSNVLVSCGLFLELDAATSFRMADLDKEKRSCT